jgi:alpha-ketoglutarate-dependent taurine dioxygenase
LKAVRRRPISVSETELVKAEFFSETRLLPMVATPLLKGICLDSWAISNLDFIESNLLKYGAILFRNFKVSSPEEFERFIRIVSGELLEYRERSSPRSQVSGAIYTSTDYPADHSIFLHNENSYQRAWPLRIYFYCAVPAQHGGETPIANCRELLERIHPKIVEKFVREKVMYVRNFGAGVGLPWQTVFQTTEKLAVEQLCKSLDIQVEWKSNNQLRTRAVREAVRKHPATGEMVWFNHATFFHVSTLEESVRKMVLAEFQEDDLPTNSYYGDGSRIEPEVLEDLREAYRRASVKFPWEQGDVLMLDNMLTAHGREPYAGPRKVLVGMANPVSGDQMP